MSAEPYQVKTLVGQRVLQLKQNIATLQNSRPTSTTGEEEPEGNQPTAHELEIRRFQEAKVREAEERQRKEAQAIEEANIPRRYASASMEGIKNNMPTTDRWVTDCWMPIHSYVHRLDEHIAEGNGLILYGSRGRMKTTLAVAVLRENIRRGRGGYFVPMCSLVDMLRSKWDRDATEAAAFDQRLRNTSLLILDDLGAEGVEKDWVLNKVQSIITDRYNNMKATVITTNLTKDELTKAYAGRIIDRLKETTISIEFKGDSFRQSLVSRMGD